MTVADDADGHEPQLFVKSGKLGGHIRPPGGHRFCQIDFCGDVAVQGVAHGVDDSLRLDLVEPRLLQRRDGFAGVKSESAYGFLSCPLRGVTSC